MCIIIIRTKQWIFQRNEVKKEGPSRVGQNRVQPTKIYIELIM